MILLAGSEGPDQSARKRRLIRAFAVRICSKTRFRMARPDLYNSILNSHVAFPCSRARKTVLINTEHAG